MVSVDAYPVRSQYRADSASQLLTCPASALLTVSTEAAQLLDQLGISTIFDLGASILFDTARRIVDAADPTVRAGRDFIGADFLDADHRSKSPSVLADSEVNVLRQVGPETSAALRTTLGISTIRELAGWPAYRAARTIINDAYGFSPPIVDDPERPDDLIPVARRYATERVLYDVIVLDRLLDGTPGRQEAAADTDKRSRTAANREAAPTRSSRERRPSPFDLAVQPLDIANATAAPDALRPALGAIVSYQQSWFPHGLALGNLLHSMALAPGESTRIAVVDWQRSVRARTVEDTTQTESLEASIDRSRALGEVTRAVATEAQQGFSGTSSSAHQVQLGGSAGVAGILPFGPAVGTAGFSAASADSSTSAVGWASSSGRRELNAEMTQNVLDRTHQAANSVRNRRATAVTEVSQQESETLSTRVVTNYNHMHALTVQYFEVVQVYRVVVSVARTTRCLFVPVRPVRFTPEIVTRYRDAIASAGLTPEVRAIGRAAPNTLTAQAPAARGDWLVERLELTSRAMGQRVARPGDPALTLPLDADLQLTITGGDALSAAFDTAVWVSKQGERVEIGFDQDLQRWSRSATAHIPVGQLERVVLRRKAGQEAFEATEQVYLGFDIVRPQAMADRAWRDDSFGAFIEVEIPPNVPEVTILAFGQSLSIAELSAHLEQHDLHYSSAVWRSLDAATMLSLLSLYELGGRKLIEVVDPVPVTAAGNYLVFRLPANDDDAEWETFLSRHGLNAPAPTEDLIPLPSTGVFAEAVLGRSNAAEKLDISRFWNWQDSPIPILPPEINALTSGGKANDEAPTTGKLESPVVNIMNAPSLPDPAGLAPLYGAISNGNMFRDMSGLAQVAALAGTTMGAAQTGAGQATAAAGAAQQSAANLFRDVVEIAVKAALAANGIPIVGGLAGGTDGAADRIPPSPSNVGSLLNKAAELDAAEATASDPSEWARYPGSSDGGGGTGSTPPLSPPPLVDAPDGSPTRRRRNSHTSAILYGTPGSGTGGVQPTKPPLQLVPLSNVPLDPGNGGRSIGPGALEVGDVILSTTTQVPSKLIRFATSSPVSHSMLYVGDNLVVEAIEDGVVQRPLQEALEHASFAVALRYQGLTLDQAHRIRDYAGEQLTKAYDYRYGTFQQALFRLDLLTMCAGKTGEELDACRRWVGRINLGTTTNDKWFCSELVVAAYASAGVPLTSNAPSWNSPDDILQFSSTGMLGYVGHLKTAP